VKKKHSIRNFLLASSVLVALFVVFWPTVQQKLEKTTVSSALDLIQNGAQNINYQGTDHKGVTYSVSAKNLKIISENEYVLKETTLFITLVNKKTITLYADHIIFKKAKKIATLTGNVYLKTSDNLDLKTNSAKVYLDKGYAEGKEAVDCIKGDTHIKATGFKMNDISGEVTFKGRPIFTKIS